ncbi:MAG: hypothetical protein AAF512_22425, partial [Pseudomonadota bacterium]
PPAKNAILHFQSMDQPALPSESVSYKGATHEIRASLHWIWLLQRAQVYFQTLPEATQTQVKQSLGSGVAAELISIPTTVRLERVNNRLVAA